MNRSKKYISLDYRTIYRDEGFGYGGVVYLYVLVFEDETIDAGIRWMG